tara:strand:+ start:1591 stop:2082 length:492 start_codon:yes stop_codon:yes gene_type:complete
MADFTGTPSSSVQHALQVAGGGNANVSDVGAGLRIGYFNYVHTATSGAGTGEINLVTLPFGRVRIYSTLSKIFTSVFATSADLHIGYRAHTDLDGAAVALDANAFLDNADVAGGAINSAFLLPTGGYIELNSQDGIVIYALVDAGNIEAADTIAGWVAYTNQD